MIRTIAAVALVTALSGCASLGDFANVLFGRSAQKVTRTPIWVYKPDLVMAVGQEAFQGVGVTALGGGADIRIWSLAKIDRVEISSCSRHDVCQVRAGALACDPSRFKIDTGWFGSPGKTMTYHFVPTERETRDGCSNLMIAIYDKNVLASWGYFYFRDHPENNFPAKFTCNAKDWNFQGVSVCSAKSGTIQELRLSAEPRAYRAEETCGLRKVSPTVFEFQPSEGWCRASFELNKKFHDIVINGYSEVLVRE